MSYSNNQKFTNAFLPNITINPLATSAVNPSQEIKTLEVKYKRQADNLYQNHDQNLILNVALQAVEKQKELSGAAAEKNLLGHLEFKRQKL